MNPCSALNIKGMNTKQRDTDDIEYVEGVAKNTQSSWK